MAEGDTILNAIVGAIVTTVLFFIPFSPVAGGAVAGYLQGQDTSSGIRVGALSGGFSALPMMFFALVFGGLVLGVIGFGAPDLALFSVVGFFMLILGFLLFLAYSAILGAAGGYLGAALKDDGL